MKIVVSAFLPFLKFTQNSSLEALSHAKIEDDVFKVYLPVSYETSFRELDEFVSKNNPDCIIMFGQASNSAKVKIEKLAKNAIQSERSDCDDVVINHNFILPKGDKELYTKIDVEKLSEYLRNAGIPAEVSNNAGTYVCNCLYYKTLNKYPDKQVIFIHLPLFIGQEVNPKFKYLDLLKLIRTVELTVHYFKLQ